METQERQLKKQFFSAKKECAWLNRLGEQGYRLTSRKDTKYSFEVCDGKVWHYDLEWLDMSAESEQAKDYLAMREKRGELLAATYSLWAYFVSEKPIAATCEGCKRTAAHYRNISIFLYFVDAVVAVLIGYQVYIRSFLETQGILMKVPVMTEAENWFLKILYRIAYGGKLLFHRYNELWAKLFGETKATMLLGIMIPLAVILTVIGAWLLSESFAYRYKEPLATDGEEAQEEAIPIQDETI